VAPHYDEVPKADIEFKGVFFDTSRVTVKDGFE
jgi:hypothetical protein